MVKKIFFVFICSLLICGCSVNKKVDYSSYEFTNKNWVRDTEADTETIRFGATGGFSYYCGCGNPVNDADLCEKYTYDDETKTIKLECFEKTSGTIEKIKILYVSDTKLLLDFNGNIREFYNEE